MQDLSIVGRAALQSPRSPGAFVQYYREAERRLSNWVVRIRGVENLPTQQGTGVASPNASILIGLGQWIELTDPISGTPLRTAEPVFVGVAERPRRVRCERGFSAVLVDVTPLGARRLTSAAMVSLTNTDLPAREFFGTAINTLQAELIGLSSWDDRFARAEHFVGSHLENASEVSPTATHAWSELIRAGGSIRIGSITDLLGVSHKQLLHAFRNEIGLTPKRAGRLLRLDQALGALATHGTPSWSTIALNCGYYDQAHLINEFRAYMGTTPASLLKALHGRESCNTPVRLIEEPVEQDQRHPESLPHIRRLTLPAKDRRVSPPGIIALR